MSKFVVRPDVDIPAMLKVKGYSSYRIANEKLFCSGAMHKFRHGGLPSWGELAKLVSLLHVSPVDLIAYQTDNGSVYDLTGKRLDAPAPAPEPMPAMSFTYDPYYDDDPGLPPSCI